MFPNEVHQTPNTLVSIPVETHKFLRSVAPRKAFLGMAWMKFSLKSLQQRQEGKYAVSTKHNVP